ncbi:MAG: hypothetical protein ACR2IE_09040 [Candidatus Sumerlaeaceae bacterium]
MRISFTLLLLLAAQLVFAVNAPPRINWQAKLTGAGGTPLSGTHTLFFRIYESSDLNTAGAGTLKFSESSSVSIGADGVANYAVGSVNTLSASLFTSTIPTVLEVSVDTVGNVILPRTRLEHVPFAIKALDSDGQIDKETSTYIATEVTTSPATNGSNLVSAYIKATLLTPNGQARTATNRAVVLVSPGNYDLGTQQLVMNNEFVDVVGLSSARDDQYVFGITNGAGTGVLRQTADDVRIENLVLHNKRASELGSNSTSPAAYFPDATTTSTRVTNCEFRGDDPNTIHSMRIDVNYPGTYTDCAAGDKAFACNAVASGKFTRCTAGIFSFGSGSAVGQGSVASGTFISCTAISDSFGEAGTASGTFVDCVSGGNSFAGGTGTGSVASGTFINCRATSNQAFGGGAGSVASGTFINCIANANNCFGGGGGTASGTFTGCIGNGTGHFGGASGGTCSGTFTNCTGGNNSFGGSANSIGAKLFGCRMTGGTWTGTFGGRMENCTWSTGFILSSTARIYNSTFVGVLDFNSQAAGMTQSRAQLILIVSTSLAQRMQPR